MTSSPTDTELDRLEAELGHCRQENLNRNPSGEDVATLLAEFRGRFAEAARHEGVGTRELARRLEISPASVSRTLNSSNDMRISTISLLASAIDSYWHVELKKKQASSKEGKQGANFFQTVSESDPQLLLKAVRNSARTNAVWGRNSELETKAFEYA